MQMSAFPAIHAGYVYIFFIKSVDALLLEISEQ